jgi:thioredoxin-related protein
MKRILILISAFIIIGLLSCGSDKSAPESANISIGAKLPLSETKMKDISGRETTLKEAMKSNGLLVMFSCNTCPYVIKNQERTKQICQYAIENNIGVILVNSNEGTRDGDDSFEEMKKYASAQGYKWLYTVDEKSAVADAFGANRTPECFLFNKKEALVYHGAIDDNPSDANNIKRNHLKEAINEMVAGKQIAVNSSRSVGCTIKR